MNASGIEPIAKMIVIKLKFNKTKRARKQRLAAKIIAFLIEIFPDAIGLFLVLKTFASNSLSKMSFTLHQADRINIEPKKNKIRK